jgi:general secretion pathway protein I
MRRASSAAGFTLLEIMIALGILAMTLVVLLEIVTNNVRATAHAKATTTATFLARGKMIDLEDQILETGFSNSDETANGTFKDVGHAEVRWESAIERVELPMDMAQQQKDKAQDEAKDSSNPMSMITGFIGGMMGSFIEPIRLGLQESVRRVTVRVFWDENGRPDLTFDVVQYLTDPSKLDASLTGAGVAANAASGASGAAGGGGGLGATLGSFGVPSIARSGTK